jgi:hypothetical protein
MRCPWVDQGRPAGIDLLAQVGDVEFDDVGLAAEVVLSDVVQDCALLSACLGFSIR